MLSILALLVATQLPTETYDVLDGTLLVEGNTAVIEGTFEVTTCDAKSCQTDLVDDTLTLNLGTDRMRQLGEGSAAVTGGWLEVGAKGRVDQAELDIDGSAMTGELAESLPEITPDDEYGIVIYIIYIGDDDDE
ncbi:MAG: hypothetical protein HN348_16715 [Proteobacteria bacterium]|jgi:hypothetical protein|nr:hypothetical protein [Pseudomonadota bacterium]